MPTEPGDQAGDEFAFGRSPSDSRRPGGTPDGMPGPNGAPGDESTDPARAAVDQLLSELRLVVSDAAVDEAIIARTRERWLRTQAEEQATMSGLLLDLAERSMVVVVQTVTGRRHQGRLTAVTDDCCVLRSTVGHTVLLPMWALASVRPGPGQSAAGAAAGARRAPVHATLAGILADLAGDRPRIRLVCEATATVLTGELRAAGEDILTMRVEADPPALIYVRLASVSEVSLFGSG